MSATTARKRANPRNPERALGTSATRRVRRMVDGKRRTISVRAYPPTRQGRRREARDRARGRT